MKINSFLKTWVIISLILFLSGCTSFGEYAGMTKDEIAVAKGIKAWNENEPAAAMGFWNKIEEPELKSKYMQYLSDYETASKLLQEAATIEDSDRILESYDKAYLLLYNLPSELKIPEQDKTLALHVAEISIERYMQLGKLRTTKKVVQNTKDLFGTTPKIDEMQKISEVVTASWDRVAPVDTVAKKAIAVEDFDDRIKSIEIAISKYDKTNSILIDEANKLGVSDSSFVKTESLRIKRRQQNLFIEREKQLRNQAYMYKELAGKEFARVPSGKNPGNLSLKELLDHYESVKEGISRIYDEVKAFSEKYPDVMDEDFMVELQSYKDELNDKIAKVIEEIKKAEEIASRGKVVMPVMIGLFNPDPSSSKDSKKSRPAKFSAEKVKKADYWWGMVAIPPGEMNDLVITVTSGCSVRVFPVNTKSGKLIKKNKIPDLVNRAYRVGNSWPVLNAGALLPTDKYFFEVTPGPENYSGEVVVYSSFIARLR
ncbi:hypothetical protein WKV44_05245 [Spirochaetia bacterium 38H-sp]|uniref:Uncharacterized protein n=1 Tax=Rarispira pelagica TaxID=3141764 RepID=A0ABU9UBW1_9SPIR